MIKHNFNNYGVLLFREGNLECLLYSLLKPPTISVGRLISNSAAGRRFYRHFTADYISCAGGGLFYDSYAFYAGSPVPGYGACPDGTKSGEMVCHLFRL